MENNPTREEVAVMFGVEPYDMAEALQHAAGILDIVKGEWGEAWSEHDQRTRAGITLAIVTERMRLGEK